MKEGMKNQRRNIKSTSCRTINSLFRAHDCAYYDPLPFATIFNAGSSCSPAPYRSNKAPPEGLCSVFITEGGSVFRNQHFRGENPAYIKRLFNYPLVPYGFLLYVFICLHYSKTNFTIKLYESIFNNNGIKEKVGVNQ